MHAIVIHRTGGHEVLTPTEIDEPDCLPDQVVVDVECSGVNYHDVYVRSGQYPKPLPYVPGIEGAGTVREVGSNVSGIAVGARVAWVNQPGGYATRVAIPADRAVPLPADLPTEAAAAVLLQGMTAHYLTEDTFPVGPGDIAVVHAAAGGMGLLLTQLIKRRGGVVIGTVSSRSKARLAREAGVDEIVDSTITAGIAAAVRDLTRGRGADVVYDGVGAPTFDASLACLRPRGTLATFGQAGGLPPPVDLLRLRDAGSVYLIRPDLNHYIATREELLARAEAVFGLAADGLRVRIGGRYPLAEAARAHEDLQGRRTTGKLLLYTGPIETSTRS